MESEKSRKGIYYGWIVFAVCFFMVFISLGFGSSTKSTYLKAICDDLGFERSLFSLNDSLRFITTSVLSFFFGSIVMKLGPRRMVSLGFIFLISSFTIYSFATQLWQFYIGGALLGAGTCWTTTTIVGYIVEKWFTNGKGTIMGIILAANGFGGVVSENVITRIVYETNLKTADANLFTRIVAFFANFFGVSGWRLAYRISALLFLITAVIVVLLLRGQPSDMGLKPLGEDKIKKEKRGLNWTGYDMKTILKKPYFYVSGICVFTMGFILQSMSNVSKTHMLDNGLSTEYIVAVFSIHALVLAFSKILCGFIYDRFGIRFSFGICCVSAVVATTSLAFITSGSRILPWVYSIMSSFGLPLETVMIPLLVSHMFGKKSYARVMGYYLALNTLGYACGAPLTNLFYDIFGTYRGILIILTVVMPVASIVAQFSIRASDRDRVVFLKEEAAAEPQVSKV